MDCLLERRNILNLNLLYKEFIFEKSSYCADESLEYYEENVTAFLYYLRDEVGLDLDNLDPDKFTKELFLNYLVNLRKKPIKNTSVITYYRAVKVFSSWLYSCNYIDVDYSKKLKLPRPDNDVKVPLTATEVRTCDALFNLDNKLGCRNYCIFHLLLDCGLRRGEIVNLTFDSFDFNLNVVFLDGKGSKKRAVPLPGFLKKQLIVYRDKFRPAADHNYWFCNIDSSALNINSVKMLFERLKSRTSIPRIHAHLLRHTFATSYILGGGNLEFLRLLMGHSDYETTRTYLHLANTCLILHQDVYHLDPIFFQNAY